jgi:oxaloacetate decarboxylase alpha subunit
MTIVEMLQQSAVLTLLGMAVVFAFLWLMIVCVGFVGKAVHKMGLDKDVLPPEPSAGPAKRASPAETAAPAKTAAVAGAIAATVNEPGNQAAAYSVNVNGVNHNVVVAPEGTVPAVQTAAANPSPEPAALTQGSTVILSPVAGTVLRYAVNEGDHVAPGDNVIIIESMKMELEIKATAAGSVHFLAPSGAQVASQQPLAEISHS